LGNGKEKKRKNDAKPCSLSVDISRLPSRSGRDASGGRGADFSILCCWV
jgi:hypothetical protein